MKGQISLTIARSGQRNRHFHLDPGIYKLGSDENNEIVIPGDGVAWRHAILSLTEEGGWVEDLGSELGTTVNDTRVEGHMNLEPDSRMIIGPYCICLGDSCAENQPPAPPPAPSKLQKGPPPPPPSRTPPPAKTKPKPDPLHALRSQVYEELLERMDMKRLTARGIKDSELKDRVRKTLDDLLKEVQEKLPQGVRVAELRKTILDEALGLGPLEDLLEDPDITEIMVNGPDQIYVEKQGQLQLLETGFSSSEAVHAIIERIVAPIGRRIDESQPYVDARLPDGSRVNAIIAPLSLIGPCLTIRKFSKIPFTMDDLIRFNSINEGIADFIRASVQLRKSMIIAGGTGSGKTTLLNVISSYIPDNERIITIEDAAELRLSQQHVIRLESRPPNIEGRGAISIRDLVRNALRMRPDRIVVGECRGGESLDMLQAMNTGHEGSLTTVHANSPRDVLSRLETMVLMSGMELPLRAIREQVGSAVDLIVQIARLSDGSRRVTRVTELVGLEGDKITMQDLFEFKQTGLQDDGKVIGHYRATGSVPTYLDQLKSRGIDFDPSIFDPNLSMP